MSTYSGSHSHNDNDQSSSCMEEFAHQQQRQQQHEQLESTSFGHGGLGGLSRKKSVMAKSSYALTSLLAENQELHVDVGVGEQEMSKTLPLPLAMAAVKPTTLAAAIVADAHSYAGESSVQSDASTDTAANTTIRTTTTTTTTTTTSRPAMSPRDFGKTLQQAMGPRHPPHESLDFRHSQNLRQALELPLRHARRMRDLHRASTSTNHHYQHPFQRTSNTTTTTTTTCDHYPNGPPSHSQPQAQHNASNYLPLTSWVGLPYASLREERPFLYDHMHTHPLADVLCQSLDLTDHDLSQLHGTWNPKVESAQDHQRRIFQPLVQDATKRQAFTQAYESFVTSCCIPLLHASALQKGVFNTSSNNNNNNNNHNNHDMNSMMAANRLTPILPGGFVGQQQQQQQGLVDHHGLSLSSIPSASSLALFDPILYRYQVFPTISVVYPDDPEACAPPTCDLSHDKSVGWLHFHVPLTASVGTSALYCEHFPGREDWHALRCTSVGLGYCWDGARCLQFTPLNTTGQTRVSLDFRILLVRASTTATTMTSTDSTSSRMEDTVHDDPLCRPHHLHDAVMREPGFYEEATMDTAFGAVSTRQRRMMHPRHSTGSSTPSGSSGGNALCMQHRRRAAASTTPVQPDARCGFPFA